MWPNPMMPIRMFSQFVEISSTEATSDYSVSMESNYLLTVLIPCHSLHYLSKSIESIAQQTLPKEVFEVLLVGDRINLVEANSVLSKSGLNFRIIESQKPGIVSALNFGLENTSSEFVARMDEDDLMLPKRLELQYHYLLRNKETLVVGGQLQLIDVDDKVIGISSYKKRISKDSAHVLRNSPIAHPAAMFRREAVEKIGGYRDFLPEDWDLWVRLNESGPIDNLKETVLKYRVHSNQLSREKMYGQQIGREFVSTSRFARMSGIMDAPITTEHKYVWLEETQGLLLLISSAFRRFQANTKKNFLISEALQTGTGRQRLARSVRMLMKFPIMTTSYLLPKVFRKIGTIGR
jgi:glycosyltransferase involved in cell wall biosynthesis